MRTILYTIMALAVSVNASAQEKESSLLNTANAEYAQMRYSYAIPLYKGYLKKNTADGAATLQLAKCYQINNQYDSAIKYTQQAISLGAATGNMLPELLANKADYAAAIAAYGGLNTPLAITRKAGFGKVSSYTTNALNYTIHYLDINTPFNEFAAIPYKDGFVFESNRAETIKGSNEFGWDGSAYSKLYFTNNKKTVSFDSVVKSNWIEKSLLVASADIAKQTSNDVDKIFTRKYDYKKITFPKNDVKYFDASLNSKFNVGAICFTADSSTAYFTKNQDPATSLIKSNENEKHLLEIWSASVTNGKLSNFKKLAFNTATASYFHPVLSKNNKRLYFISDQAGGQGGTDLYYVEKDAQGNWGSPVNAGDKVNTAANELYPTIAEGELYISSNGQEGLGGLDIYKVIFQNDKITGVENIGAPINSATDDMSYTRNSNAGYFVSNRFGSDDIFSFEYALNKVILSGKVYTNDGSKPVILVKLFTENPHTLIETVTLDANNGYSFLASPNVPYSIEASEPKGNKAEMLADANGYTAINKEFVKPLKDIIINIPAEMAPVVAEKKVTFNNIIDSLKGLTNNYLQLHHNFDKTSIVKGDIATYNQLIGRIKGVNNARIVVISAADCMGNPEYNEKLSARRADAITALVKKANKKNTFVSMHFGERVLVEPCDFNAYDMEYQKENRYTYIFILK
jgi:outer membrane protein OmpA-like peptidoglycan-associated protein